MVRSPTITLFFCLVQISISVTTWTWQQGLFVGAPNVTSTVPKDSGLERLVSGRGNDCTNFSQVAKKTRCNSLAPFHGRKSFVPLICEWVAEEYNHLIHLRILAAYAGAFLLMLFVTTFMFYHLGIAMVIQVVLYVISLAFIKMAMIVVFALDYAFPIFVTALHLAVSSLVGFCVLVFLRISIGKKITTPTPAEFVFTFVPIVLTFAFSITLENQALVVVSSAFAEAVSSSNPVISFLMTYLLGVGFHADLFKPVLLVVLGCLVSVEEETSFSLVGMAMLLGSAVLRSVKSVLQQKLLTGEKKEQFDPVTLMAWSCMMSSFFMGGYALAAEGVEPLYALAHAEGRIHLLFALAWSCAIAVVLNVSNLYVIREIGAVGVQMVSQMKAVLVVIGGIAILNESFTDLQKVGFGLILAGVFWFSSSKTELEMEQKT